MRRVPCAPTQDASCAACPAPPLGVVSFAGASCERVAACSAGWLLLANGTHYCVPCPIGHFCADGQTTAEPCGDGCTTATTGTPTYLGCHSSSANSSSLAFSVQSTVFFGSAVAVDDAACPPPFDRWVESWVLPYGAYQGSTFRWTSPTLAIVTYAVVVPRCIAGRLLEDHLRPLIAERQTQTAVLIAACTGGTPILMLTPPLLLAAPFSSSAQQQQKNDDTQQQNHSSVPAFVIERRRWGQSRNELAWTLTFVGASLTVLCAGLCAACGLALVRWQRRRRRVGVLRHAHDLKSIFGMRDNNKAGHPHGGGDV